MPARAIANTLLAMGVLTNESVSVSAAFAEGVEIEETFPEPTAAPVTAAMHATAAPPAPPKAALIRPEPTLDTDASEAAYQDKLDRRLREAEALVKQTIERLRLDEEARLAEWVRERREEEERRLQKWIDERRSSVERSMEKRKTADDGLAERIEGMLAEWQARFEQRLEQRRAADERDAERRRVTDEERLREWRGELEKALTERFAERRERTSLPDRNGEMRSPVRDALGSAASARDVGRILRDLLAEVAHTSTLALAVHGTTRDEVAYRYRVASDDELGTLLRRDALDDGPQSAAAHMDGWVRAQRPIRIGARNVVVHTAQCAVRSDDSTLGVLTLQTEQNPIADAVLARVTDIVRQAAPRLAQLRAAGSYRGN